MDQRTSDKAKVTGINTVQPASSYKQFINLNLIASARPAVLTYRREKWLADKLEWEKSVGITGDQECWDD